MAAREKGAVGRNVLRKEGAEKVTGGKSPAAQTFLLNAFCGIVGIPMAVKAFNEVR